MKTTSLTTKHAGKRLLQTLILILGIGLFNTALACTANFTYTIGINGHVSFTSTCSGYTFPPYCTWDPGDASGMMYGNTPTHVYVANGTYNVTLIATDDSSCSDTITIPITISNVTQPCTLSPSFTVSYGSHGNVTFTSTSKGTYANTLYFWNPGDGSGRVSGTTTYNHTYVNKGTYFVWLILKDTGSGYCFDSVQTYITVVNADSNSKNCNLVVSFTYSIGQNGNVYFTSTSSGNWGDSLRWNPGDASGITEISPYVKTYHHSYTANGTYNVQLYIGGEEDSSYCLDSVVVPITITNVDNLEPCTLSANFNVTYDSNGLVTFTSTSTGTYANTLYYWNPGDGSGTQLGSTVFTHTYSFIGNYPAWLVIKDTGAGFCIDSISLPVNIYNRDSLQASFIYNSDSLNAGQYDFFSTSRGTNNNTYYRWDPGDSTAADSAVGMTTYHHTYSKNGPYSATLTIWYTIPPKAPSNSDRLLGQGRYDESSYTQVINVSTVPSGVISVTSTPGSFTLYPNPNNGMFRISLKNVAQNGEVELSVSNVLGEVILKTSVAVSDHTLTKDIDIRHTPAGIYFVKVVTPDKTYTSKLVIQK